MAPKPTAPNRRLTHPTIQPTAPRNTQRGDSKRRHPNRQRRRQRGTGKAAHDDARRRLLRSHDPTIRDRRRETIRFAGEARQLGGAGPASSSIRRNTLDRPHHPERQQTSPMDPRPMRPIRQTTRPSNARILRTDRTKTRLQQSHRRSLPQDAIHHACDADPKRTIPRREQATHRTKT
jgi:hypothetical protein